MVKTHVKACKLCQIHNKHVVKYKKLNYDAKPAPMRFIVGLEVLIKYLQTMVQNSKMT